MHAEHQDIGVSQVAAAIAEPARTKILCSLMDGHARTSTELATIAEVSASTASVHLAKLKDLALLRLHVQGRHRYYSLADQRVAQALEALMVIGQNAAPTFKAHTPDRLQFARTCYDHMAGTLAVLLHDRLLEAGWLVATDEQAYRLSDSGEALFLGLGIEVQDLTTPAPQVCLPVPGLEHAPAASRWFAGRGVVANGVEAQVGDAGSGQSGVGVDGGGAQGDRRAVWR